MSIGPSPFSVSATLFVAAAGAGLLSYPYAVHQQGIIVNFFATLAVAAVTIFTDRVLVATAGIMRLGGALKGENTFDALAGAALGPRARTAAIWSLLLGTGGSMIGFLIVIGDLLAEPLRSATGCGSSAGGACALTSRAFLIPVIAVCVAPLSSLGALAHMRHSSALAAATVLVITGVLAVAGARALSDGGLHFLFTSTASPSGDDANDVVLFRLGIVPFFLALPISVFTLGNHCQVVPAYLEAIPGSPAHQRFATSINFAVLSCVVTYELTGIGGYVAFRSSTAGDVLLNLHDNDASAAIAKILLAIHVALAYPVLLFPARAAITAVAVRSHSTLLAAPYASNTMQSAALAITTAFSSPAVVAAAFTITATLLAVACPQVSVVFGLVGATVATAQIHLFPALCLWAWADAREGRIPRLANAWGGSAEAWSFVESGALPGDETCLLSTETESTPEAAPDVKTALDSEPALRYLSTSPTTLRVQAVSLLLFFFVVGTVGTSSYVIDTFFK